MEWGRVNSFGFELGFACGLRNTSRVCLHEQLLADGPACGMEALCLNGLQAFKCGFHEVWHVLV